MSNPIIINAVIEARMIAPCGMNCSICSAHLPTSANKCHGCSASDNLKRKSCTDCAIANCALLKTKQLKYCSKKCASSHVQG